MRSTTGTRDGQATKDGAISLHTHTWEPDGEPVADVLLIHGYAEHSGRYEHVAQHLTDHGLRVVAVDHRGHGQTTGLQRGLVDDFDLLVDDLAATVADECGSRPLFVYGRSMGGLAAVRLAERSGIEPAGVIVASAALVPAESIPKPLVALVNIIGKLAPKLPTIQLEGDAISRDQAVRTDYDNDPLNYRGKIPANTGRQMNLAMQAGMAQAASITCPVLIIHGGKDRLTEVSGAHMLHDKVGSSDKTIRIWPEAYHELHNEPEKAEVLTTITDWMTARLP